MSEGPSRRVIASERNKSPKIAVADSREAAQHKTPTVAHAVAEYLRVLQQNPLAGASALDGWADSVRNHLEHLGILNGLLPAEQKRLAQRVTELSEIESAVPSVGRLLGRERKEWTRRGRGYITLLRQKTRAARQSVSDLRAYVKKIGVDDKPLDDAMARALAAFDVVGLEQLQQCLPGVLSELSNISRKRTDDALVRLYDFFVQCSLPKGEAEARAATISNEYWDTRFTITDRNSDGEKSRGCDAIRRRVERGAKRDTSETPS